MELVVAHCLSTEVINSGPLQSQLLQPMSFLAIDIYAKLVFSILKGSSKLFLLSKVCRDGKSVHLTLDERRGSGFVSHGLYLHSYFNASIMGRSPHQQHARALSGPPSPVHTMLSHDISMVRRESIAPPVSVHPLPLPPGAAVLLPPAAATFSHAVAKSESLPMNSQWQKGKLIGRGTFGSVYVATNRETGALCAMKEVELFPDNPKCAECIKQLEQRWMHVLVLEYWKALNLFVHIKLVAKRFYIRMFYLYNYLSETATCGCIGIEKFQPYSLSFTTFLCNQ